MDNTIEIPVTVNGYRCRAKVLGHTWMHGKKPYTAFGVYVPVKSQTNGAFESVLVQKPISELTEGGAILALRHWAQGAHLVPCVNKGCSNPAWNRTTYPSQYRDLRCEDCWMLGWKASVDEMQKDRLAKNRREDTAAKANGYTHKTVAWVHPQSGDDYQLIWHSKGEMGDRAIQAVLRREHSTVMNDYTQTVL